MVDFKILIVENDNHMRDLMYNAIKDSFKTECVKTGADALVKIKEFKPDLALVDYQISDMSSVQLQQEISKKYNDTHTAMISNIDRSKISLESMKRRAMDYIYRSEDTQRFINDVCKLVRYLIDVKYKVPQETALIASGFYDFAKKLYEEKKWTVQEIQRILEERKK